MPEPQLEPGAAVAGLGQDRMAGALDWDACAAEPIRIPGGVQPHGALAVVDLVSGRIIQASRNLGAFLGLEDRPATLRGLDPTQVLELDLQAWSKGEATAYLRALDLGGRLVQVSAYKSEQGLIVELEEPPADESQTLEALYPRLRRFISLIEATEDLQTLAQIVAREVRALTGFNRVKLYSFDEIGDGTVLAEDRDEILPSYLDLRFPAADIPAQARALYRLNRLRLIPDANYVAAPLEPALSPVDGQPLDLSGAALRSVSPIHLQYMRNMGTLSSMSISILVEGQLWGLISGHSAQPHMVNAQVRAACDLLGQVVSLQIAARVRTRHVADQVKAKRLETELLGHLAQASEFTAGLIDHPGLWMDLMGAGGAAIVSGGMVVSVGQTPGVDEILHLAEWLKARAEPIYATDSLASVWPEAENFAGRASGLLAIAISQLHADFILWFRPEVVRTVAWSGDPTKPTGSSGDVLHPRQSFDRWKEQVRLRSLPWTAVQIECASDFRSAIQSFVLRRAEERAALTAQLERSNAELEAFSYSISHDLRAPFRHIVGYAELLRAKETNLDERARHYVQTIVDAALNAGRLVDDLLAFSHLGRSRLSCEPINVNALAAEAQAMFSAETDARSIGWSIADLPPAWGDGALVRQVLVNLMDNAVKYTRPQPKPHITVGGEDRGESTAYWVTDNGVGFDMAYVGKVFGVFQRLHRAEDFEGTGIGLALSKRIVDRHQGTIAAQGKLDHGATVLFTLPKMIVTGTTA